MSSRGGYVLGTLLVVLAVAGATAFLVNRLGAMQDRIDSFPSAALDQGVVELEAREYSVYLDVPSGEPKAYEGLAIVGPDGVAVALQPTSGRFRYSLGGRSGERIGKVSLTRAGRYQVQGFGALDARLVFGDGLTGGLLTTILGTLAIAFAGIAVGVVVLVRTAGRRKRERVPQQP